MVTIIKQIMKRLVQKPLSYLRSIKTFLALIWKSGKAAWKRRKICVYLWARRYCKIKEKTILWEAFDGRGILDNPKALFEAMLADPDFKDWKHIWVLDDLKNHEAVILQFKSYRNVEFVIFKSLHNYLWMALANVVVTNNAPTSGWCKRKGQIIIDSWHGIPLKYIGKRARNYKTYAYSPFNARFRSSDYLVSASSFLTEVYLRDYELGSLFDGEIIEAGYPRLDTLVNVTRETIIPSLARLNVNINPAKKLIVYAPTWRGDKFASPEVSIDALLSVKARIESVLDCSQWQVLIKPHQIVYNAARKQFKDLDFMIPATVDANEVLAITDVLVSDFSSIFYDFLLTKRPIVFYIPDLEEYKSSRGLYHSVDTLPGPVCQTLDELADTFTDLEAAVKPFAERYAEQRTWAGCDFDKGTNSRTIMRHILLGEPAAIAEKEPEKTKLLFTLPPRQGRATVTALLNILKQIDYTHYDVTLLTDGDKIGTLDRLDAEVPQDVRVIVRRGIFRTFMDEVRWLRYCRWGSASPKGQKVLPETWFREEIMRYLGQKPFDLVVDITGSSLFYTTFAARVPAKACVIWALDDLPALAQTTQKGLSKIFGTYVAFDAVTTTDEQLLTRIQAGFSQTACGTLPCERLEKRLGRLGISVVNTPPCCEQRFDFSIIMAVYKVEPYLREAIESVVKQDIGFENHVQLILVDDGSPDNSGAICDEYAAKYPENIIVIHKENGGVASARNAGIEVATGTYLNFMDPDDKLSLNTLSKVKAFYIAHPSGVDIATIPVFFFEAIKGPHPTNDKFKQGTRIVNLLEEPEIIQCNVAPTFIRKSVIKGTRFCLNLNYAEDGCFIQTLLLRSPALGVITGCKYFYRKRKSGTSALQKNNPMFYQTPRYFYLPYVRKAQAVFGRVPRFVACVLSHYLQWDLKSITGIPEDIGLSQDEREKCHSEYLEAFQFADDHFILNSKNVYLEHRLAYFRTKYGTAPQLQHLEQDASITFSAISDVLTYPFLQWHSMRAEKGKLFLCVAFVQFSGLPEVTEVFAKCGEKVFAAKLLASRDGTSFMDEPMYQRHLYEFEFAESDLPKTARLTFHFTQGGETYQATRISRHFRFPLSDQFAAAYCILNKKCILARGATLIITDKYHHWKKELKLLLEIFKKRKGRWKEDLFIRVIHFIRQKLHCKPIWLLKDRSQNADDNAEALFLHLREHHPEVNAYFVIDHTSPDGKRLEQFGKICPFASRKHRILSALSAVALSSQVESWFLPEEVKNHALRDSVALRPFVFLQHGVSKDFVGWLWKFTQNLTGLVAAAIPEAQAFLDEPYGYSAREIWLTGFPRFDRLYHNEQKVITFMPTWRQWLFTTPNQETGVWTPRPGFTESNYFKFYNELLSNERLISAAQELGYTLTFFPHPMVRLNGLVNEFNLEAIQVLESKTPYREIYAKSDLVVTDYSSAIFDFAYLRKPVLYAQFDKDEMFSGKHTLKKGYFDYERDGFGEVTYTLEDMVDCLIEYMKNNCQLKEKYRERIDNFFAFNDRNNCERVYQKVCELIQQ